MKENKIREATSKIKLSDEKKKEIIISCSRQVAEDNSIGRKSINKPFLKICLVAVIAAILSVSAFAVAKLTGMNVTKDGTDVKINAALDSDRTETDAPLRAWNSDEELGEISVRLAFEFLPDDLSEDLTASHKYRGDKKERAITFRGYDLRRSDFETIVKNVSELKNYRMQSF